MCRAGSSAALGGSPLVLGQYPQRRTSWLQAAMVGCMLPVALGRHVRLIRILHGLWPSRCVSLDYWNQTINTNH